MICDFLKDIKLIFNGLITIKLFNICFTVFLGSNIDSWYSNRIYIFTNNKYLTREEFIRSNKLKLIYNKLLQM